VNKINGEMTFLLDNMEYKSRDELLKTLRAMRDDTIKFEGEQRFVLKQLIGVGIQQIMRTPEKLLLDYKKFKTR